MDTEATVTRQPLPPRARATRRSGPSGDVEAAGREQHAKRRSAANPLRRTDAGTQTTLRAGARRRAQRIRAIVLDVDGVLTDAGLYYGPDGEALKRFSARDGFAVVTAQSQGLAVAVLSGRLAPPLRSRLRDLHIPEALTVEGSRDKAVDISALAERMDVPLDAVAFVGDDLPDLPALALAGLAACPADAAPEVRERCVRWSRPCSKRRDVGRRSSTGGRRPSPHPTREEGRGQRGEGRAASETDAASPWSVVAGLRSARLEITSRDAPSP
jgi:YrbI family 3-deoxy-D-manno-octulosonate 8-phosphate phosphatase